MKLFIINLKRSPERKKLMQEKLKTLQQDPLFAELGLSYDFFTAVDSKSEQFKDYKAMFNPTLCYLLHGRILIDSEIACYASHYSLWEECVRLNEAICVLEDDIDFEAHFLNALKDIVATKFLFVRFFTSCKNRDKYIYKIDKNYYYSLKNTNGTLGYYITPKAAKALITQVWDSPVDIHMEFVSRHHVDNIIYKPFIISENEISQQSTIINSDGSHRSIGGGGGVALHYKILKPFYRTTIQLKRAFFKLCYKPPKLAYKNDET